MEQKHAVVVGAGLARLAAAIELADAGHRVRVFEAAGQVGGRTSSWVQDGMEVESGLHRYLGFYTALPRLIRHVGKRLDDVVVWEDEIEILTPDGGPRAVFGASMVHKPVTSIAEALGNTHFLPAGQKLALGRMLAAGVKDYLRDPAGLDERTVTDYAREHGVSDEIIFRILVPLTQGLFFVPPEQYSMHNFMGLMVPHWDSAVLARVGAFTGGMTEVLTGPMALYLRSQGAEVRTGAPVDELIVEGGRLIGVRVAGERVEADVVVLAASIGPAQQLVAEQFSGHPFFEDFLELSYTPSVGLQFELSEPLMPVDRATFGPGTLFASFSEQSRTTFRQAQGRVSVICANPQQHIDTDVEELAEIAYDDATRLGLDIRSRVTRVRKVSIPSDFYSLEPGNEALRPGQDTPVPGLVLAGDYTQQKYLATMEGAVVSGQLAAEAAMRTHLSA
ncbi:hydroxysqualene dehydroxylase [Nesterenkonia alba]|uniref:hydroxysqualene dehydroxylase n=1 Tax=Nesterenkonia alba TaxID=515814 RepID=UPI0003B50647|nr:FAD-dependent oxidoreductase [Nesterenkonia alba]